MAVHPNSLKNLNVYTSDQDREQASINGRKGGLARQAQRRAKEREREEWQTILSLALNEGDAEEITSLADAGSKNLTISMAMKVKMVSKALKGDIKAYEAIMRFAGADEIDIATQTEVSVDNSFIDALNAKAVEIWNETAEEKE